MPFTATPTDIEGIVIVQPKRFGDHRGWFEETYHADTFADFGIDANFIQDNHAFTAQSGTLRGLHFQKPPMSQAKLLRVARGSIIDVAVDIRKGSPTFGRHVAVELSAANGMQLYVPRGFAHGYRTLEPDTHVLYKVDNHYAPDHEGGLLWNDLALNIDWRGGTDDTIINERDAAWPTLEHCAPH